MSISSYSDMKSLVARRMKRTDLTDYIPDYIALGEARIYRELRVRQMETTLSGTTASGVIALPSGYQELKFAYFSGSPTTKLVRKDSEWIYHNFPTRSSDGTPTHIGRDGTNFIFGPYPTDGLTLAGTFYKRLDALSASNTSNWLITDAPDLLLYASLIEAQIDVLRDDRIPMWEAKYQETKRRVEHASEQEEFSGSPLASTVR
jgi:hypothetical protein